MTGSVQTKTTKNGKQYYYIVLNTKPNKTWKSTGLEVKGNKRKANEMLREMLLEYERMENMEVMGNNILFWEYLEKWVNCTEVRETTREKYKSYLNNHIIPYFKKINIKLTEVKPSTLRKYYESLNCKLAKKTIRNQQGVLSKALGDAFYDDLIISNPHAKVKLVKANKPNIQTLTLDEYKKFLKLAESHDLYLPIIVLCEIAVRRSELLGIEWKNINLKTGEIHICATRNTVSKDKVEYITKTEGSDRFMYVSDYVVGLLKEEKQRQKEYKKLFGDQYVQNDLVFKYPDGRPYSATQLTRQIGNLAEESFGKRITPHRLRHTVASLMIDSNTSIYSVSKYLGHSSVNITERTYVHEKKDFNKDTLELFRKAIK